MDKQNNIGFDVKVPEQNCHDRKCPFHGDLKIRGRVFVGKVVKKDHNRTATVSWERRVSLPKYERSETKLTKIRAHNPSCLNAGIGDTVKLVESKPISKTKNFVIIEIIKKGAAE